ncbi:hypothetical protein C8J56DRAFT_790809 [Mycena floridula]|nr:hypothetical protein C8J56DRAFT_790809 [Mycena floridula]
MSSPLSPRVRGRYATKACSVCRHKRVKCDEKKPSCGYCTLCSWNHETHRRPRTEAHFEAMRKRVEALQIYTQLLESKLEICRKEHGISDNSYLQSRPQVASTSSAPMVLDIDDGWEDPEDSADVIGLLCAPTENLKVWSTGTGDGDLIYYNLVSPFRFVEKSDSSSGISRFPEIAQNPNLCYVLVVNSADLNYHNPDFDWSRHLPPEVPLDRETHDDILDKLFKFFTCWTLRIVPALFLRDMYRALSVPRSQTPPRTSHYSPMLHNSLLAVATAFSDDPRVRDMRARVYFVAKAKHLMEEDSAKSPNIAFVHALSMLASFYSSSGDEMLGYLTFGTSVRVSQALGLSVDSSKYVTSGRISHESMLDRNWAYWTTFSQDVCLSLYVGRDFCVPIPSKGLQIPVPFVDKDYDQGPWFYPASKLPPQPNFLSRTFAASCELLIIARRAMDVLNGLHIPGTRQEVNNEIITEIESKRSSHEIDHAKICKTAATHAMELLDTWRSLYTLRYVPITLIQVIFAAGTIFLLTAVQATSGLRVSKETLKLSLSDAELCIQYLTEIGKSWQCASKIADILKNILHQQLAPIMEKRLEHKHSGSCLFEPAINMDLAPQPLTPNSPDEGWTFLGPLVNFSQEIANELDKNYDGMGFDFDGFGGLEPSDFTPQDTFNIAPFNADLDEMQDADYAVFEHIWKQQFGSTA